jgi:hypothetical protein
MKEKTLEDSCSVIEKSIWKLKTRNGFKGKWKIRA